MGKYGPYKTGKALAEKIDWEGGIDYFFNHYASSKEFKDSPLYPFIVNYTNATQALEEALKRHGVTLDEY